MKPEIWHSLKSFLLELIVYAALVFGYFFAVLHLLGDWLHELYLSDRRWYAAVALLFIVAQGVLLETLTRWLLGWIKPRVEEEK